MFDRRHSEFQQLKRENLHLQTSNFELGARNFQAQKCRWENLQYQARQNVNQEAATSQNPPYSPETNHIKR